MNLIKIFIVDEDQEWIKKMYDLLNQETDFMVVGTATSKKEAVEMIKIWDLDVVLMEMYMEGDPEAGIEMTREILKNKRTKIIIITAHNLEQQIIKAFNTGVKNYILKECYEDIPNAIRQSFNNVSPVEIILRKFLELKREILLSKLTPAEKEIFAYIEEGMTITEIAGKTFRTEGTVKQHVKSILRKLGVKRRRDAINLLAS